MMRCIRFCKILSHSVRYGICSICEKVNKVLGEAYSIWCQTRVIYVTKGKPVCLVCKFLFKKPSAKATIYICCDSVYLIIPAQIFAYIPTQVWSTATWLSMC